MKQRLLFGLMITLAVLGLNGTIDLNALFTYEDQDIPLYVNRDNTPPNNTISDAGATLGRVLFYDVNLSANNAVACAHCHQQEFAFGDERVLSVGLSGGLTGRHSMRLVNARFSDEDRFFWDERAASLEDQSTRPIQDHIEMGFSGEDGDPSIDSLIRKLRDIPYYQELFTFAYGSPNITEPRMQRALA
ncbi:MAG: cytochrome-c peroxidase, partial [Bacteroidota bacterium]